MKNALLTNSYLQIYLQCHSLDGNGSDAFEPTQSNFGLEI